MSENTIETVQDLQTEQIPNPLTIEYPLRKIDEIAKDQAYLLQAISALGAPKGEYYVQDLGAEALGKAIMARETTNQKLIAFYEKMYNDLSGKRESNGGRETVAEELLEILRNPAADVVDKDRAKSILQQYMQVL